MSIQSVLITYLEGATGITDLVGTRIYPTLAPANAAKPFIVYQLISDPRIHTMDGDCGLAHPRIQIICWGATYLSAIAVAAAVKARLNSTTGTVGSTTGCAFHLIDSGDMAGPDPEDERRTLYGVRQDYELWHQE